MKDNRLLGFTDAWRKIRNFTYEMVHTLGENSPDGGFSSYAARMPLSCIPGRFPKKKSVSLVKSDLQHRIGKCKKLVAFKNLYTDNKFYA